MICPINEEIRTNNAYYTGLNKARRLIDGGCKVDQDCGRYF